MSYLNKYEGALIGLALGDALGAPHEFNNPVETEEVPSYFQQGHFGTEPGHPTDDTQLAIRCAESLLLPGELDNYPAALVRWFGGNPPYIGSATLAAARAWARGHAPTPDEHVQGNGSLMAVTPVALRHLNDRDKAMEQAYKFAFQTHPSQKAAQANMWFTTLLVLCVKDTPLDYTLIPRFHAIPDDGNVHSRNIGWCQVAYDLAVETLEETLQDKLDPFYALRSVIARGGDTDTNAAIAGALLGAKFGLDAWPQDLVDELYVKDTLLDLADQLHEAANE